MNREEVKRKESASRRKSQCESQEGTENTAEWGQGCGWGGSGDGMGSLGTGEVSRSQRYWKESGTSSPDGNEELKEGFKQEIRFVFVFTCLYFRKIIVVAAGRVG